ncbi:MAG: kinase-like domain-containing protein, partial [Olpidium bornovanus]
MANVQPVAEAPHPLRGAQLATQTIIIGDYEVGREIGRGSFATVYKGHHIATRVPVAVKSVQRSKLTKKLLESLESEIAILKAVRHEHIVELVDCKVGQLWPCGGVYGGVNGGIEHVLCTRLTVTLAESGITHTSGDGILLSGRSLKLHQEKGRYSRNRPLSERAAGRLVGAATSDDLGYASWLSHPKHPHVVVPNLLLLPAPFIHSSQSPHDRVMACLPYLKLADFGFARFLPSHSLAETLCGSPLYMAPEILRYEKYDATADLWSVGAVLFEMVVAKPPFRAQNHVELLRRIERSNDKIRFPGEEKYDSHAQYRRKSSELAMATSPRQNSVQRPAHPESIRCGAGYISEEMKGLIRRLLRRNPVERASFEEFFSHVCVVGDIGFPREAHARGNLETDIGYISTSSPATTGVLRRAVSTRSAFPLPRRPPDDTNVGAFVSDLGPEGLRDDTPLEQRPTVQWRRFSAVSSLGRVRSGAARAPIVKSALTNSPFSTRVDAPEPRAWGM